MGFKPIAMFQTIINVMLDLFQYTIIKVATELSRSAN
jgi:hypothetical protein